MRQNTIPTAVSEKILTAITIVSAIFATVSVLITLGQHRLFIETDSAGYMSLAQSITHGKGYVMYDGQWCADWPPLLPAVLALLSFLTRDLVTAFGIVAALSYGFTLLVVGRWMVGRFQWPVVLAGLGLLLTALPLRQMMNAAFSEPPFIALTATFLVICDEYRESRKLSLLCWMTLFSSLACLTRYTGIVTVGLGLLVLLRREWGRREFPLRATILLLGTLLPSILWCCLNKFHTHTFTGDRGAPEEKLPEILHHLVEVFSDWAGNEWILMSALLLLLVGLFLLVRYQRLRLASSTLFLFFAVTYTLLMVISACRVEFDPLDTRLLSPIYVPIVMTFISIMDGCLLLKLTPLGKRGLASTLGIIVALFCWHTGTRSADRADIPFDQPAHPIMRFLREHAGETVFSNDPARVWYGSRLAAASITGIHLSDDDEAIQSTIKQAQQMADGPLLLVWFIEPDEESRQQVEERLTNLVPLKVKATFDDGLIFEITPLK